MDMIVRLAGEIDCATGPAVQADLVHAMSEQGADVVADLSEVTFLDCAGLGALVAVRVWAADRGLRLRLTRPVPAVQRLLDVVGSSIEVLPSGDGETAAARCGEAAADGGFSPEPQAGKLSGVDDTGSRLQVASEQLRVADEEIRTQQELIDRLVRGRAADRLAVVRLAAALPVPLIGTDRNGVVREANPAAAALLHLDTERLRGKPLPVLVQPSDRRALRSALSRAPSGNYPEHLSITLTPRRAEPVLVDLVVIGETDEGRADRDECDAPPLVRFVLARQGKAGAGADATLLAALGSAARLSTVGTGLREALSQLAELAAQGLAPALRASLVVGSPAEPELFVSTDRTAQVADGEQHRTGGGPTWDAYATGQPVAAASLHADPRWPALRGSVPVGADAVTAAPVLTPAGAPAGVLTVYGMAALAEDTHVSRTTLFADAAAALLREHDAIAELRLQEAQLREALSSRATIDQAKGILMARHGVDAEAAFAELVRRSQHSNVKVRDVARQLVAEASSGASARLRRSRPLPSAAS